MAGKKKVAVVGGGASGLVAAIAASEEGAEVTLFEKKDRVGKKILATGNGKCNLGNLALSVEQYYCKDKEKLGRMLAQFGTEETIRFFQGLGLMLREKNGYLYPYCEQASVVLDILRGHLTGSIQVLTDTPICKVSPLAGREGLLLTAQDGRQFHFDRVILACGSAASLKQGEGRDGCRMAKELGHRIIPVVSGLAAMHVKEEFRKALAGVRCQAHIRLLVDGREQGEEQGELQFTSYGISGIPVFQLCRTAAYALRDGSKVQAALDFFPGWKDEDYEQMIRQRCKSNREKTLEEFLTGTLHKKLNLVFLKQAGLKPGMRVKEVSFEQIHRLLLGCRHLLLHIEAVNPPEQAQVCAGGVDFSQVDDCLESRLVKGVYFTGELLDVDGICGGYNLQWAWTSGYLAGHGAAREQGASC